MEAPPGLTGRFFVAVEPKEPERRAQDMAQGTVKDNVRDELDEAAGRGRRVIEDRKEAAPKEVVQPGSGGVKMSGTSWPRRKSVASRNRQSAKAGPGLAGSGPLSAQRGIGGPQREVYIEKVH
jgi:hypothetical protein